MLNKFIYHSKFSYLILRPIDFGIYRYIIGVITYPLKRHKLSKFHIYGRMDTAKILANSNKSLSRYGDGELQWMLGNKRGSFEKNSPLLRKRLIEVIKSNNNHFMVALPDAFISLNQFNNRARKLWERFVVKYSSQVLPYLNSKYTYYDTSVVRPYIDYKDRRYARLIFNELKKIWNNRNVLIVEGAKTRLGVGNDLFNNAKRIRRIECPVNYAFELYKIIYDDIISFLSKHKSDKYITLISLGPTATILSYDIFNQGYRALDIGHIDLEYTWFLMGVKKPINISYKYTNESNYNKMPSKKLKDKKYINEIVDIIN